MSDNSDPRVYFAAERTLLAWLRSAIAVTGLGFLVARFGVFLTMIRGQQETSAHIIASAIGIVFVLLGALMIAGAAWQHLKFIRTLSQQNLPQQYSTVFSLSIAALVATAAVALSIYLATTTSRSPWRQATATSIDHENAITPGTIERRQLKCPPDPGPANMLHKRGSSGGRRSGSTGSGVVEAGHLCDQAGLL